MLTKQVSSVLANFHPWSSLAPHLLVISLRRLKNHQWPQGSKPPSPVPSFPKGHLCLHLHWLPASSKLPRTCWVFPLPSESQLLNSDWLPYAAHPQGFIYQQALLKPAQLRQKSVIYWGFQSCFEIYQFFSVVFVSKTHTRSQEAKQSAWTSHPRSRLLAWPHSGLPAIHLTFPSHHSLAILTESPFWQADLVSAA